MGCPPAGTPREVVAMLTGHSTLDMIDYYNTVPVEAFGEAMAKRAEVELARQNIQIAS